MVVVFVWGIGSLMEVNNCNELWESWDNRSTNLVRRPLEKHQGSMRDVFWFCEIYGRKG